MRFKKIKSLFSDGTPYIDFNRGLDINDFEIKIHEQKSDPEKALTSVYSRTLYSYVYLIPKEELIAELESLNLNNVMNIFKYDNYASNIIFGTPSDEKIHYLWKNVRSQDIKFTGLRTPQTKKNKYLRLFDEFMSDFKKNKDKIIKEILDEANKSLSVKISKGNEKYTEQMLELYTGTRYEKQWEEDWDKDPSIKILRESKSSIQKKINALDDQVKELNGHIKTQKINITKEELEKKENKLAPEVYDEIISKLDSGNAWKKRGMHFR